MARSFDLYLPCGLRRNFMKARPVPLSLTKFVKSITVSLLELFIHPVPFDFKYKTRRITIYFHFTRILIVQKFLSPRQRKF